MSPSQEAHLLVIPFPAQGHLLALLDLLRHLSSSLPTAITATVLTTPANLPLLTPFLSPAIQPLVLPLPSHSSLPAGVEHVRHLPFPSLVAALVHSLSLLRPRIVAWARDQPNPPTAVLSDFFLGWTHHLAAELSIPRFAFYSSGALLVSVFDALFANGAVEPLPPPLPAFRYDHLPSLFRRYEAGGGTAEWELVRESMLANSAGHAAVINTLQALESKYLDHLSKSYGHDRVWAVGPIPPSVPGSVRGGKSSVPVEELAAWLAACPAKSVVYVCFGSQYRLAGPRAEALAAALESSEARFVWCVGEAEVPGGEGFERRTKGRGLVIRGWAPQVEVLGHAAVGAFLTHCGWNSVLEGVVAGAVLLAWPMEADQFVNATLLVEEMGVAVSACEGGPDAVPEVEALAKVLKESAEGDKWPEVRGRAEEMRRKAAEAVAEGGSSYENMKKLAREVSGNFSG